MSGLGPDLAACPPQLAAALAEVAGDGPLYLTGGAVRDWLAGKLSRDLDFTLPAGAGNLARRLASRLGAAFVALDSEHDVARVVWRDLQLDFAGFREGTTTIAEDLGKRDFTINALALPLELAGGQCRQGSDLLDPTNGLADLRAGIIRATNPEVFEADPLRLVRAYRFFAALEPLAAAYVPFTRRAGAPGERLPAPQAEREGFADTAAAGPGTGMQLDPATEALITQGVAAHLLAKVAVERVRMELDLLLGASRAAPALQAMAAAGLLFQVLPELAPAAGLEQPASHHLDVAGHCIETLACLGPVLADPEKYFPGHGRQMQVWFNDPGYPHRRLTLFWAALLHDLGKPAACDLRAGRITFHNHDRIGAEQCRLLARRLKFSRERSALLARLVAHHMWPFHLSNARLRQGITPKACWRLLRAVGADLPALFLLAMADSLAGRGPGKPPAMEDNLAALYTQVREVAASRVEPVLLSPPLLNGHDLQRDLGLTPGPLFKKILLALERATVSGEVSDRRQALNWVRSFLQRR